MFFLMVHLTMLPLSQIIWNQVIGWLMYDELKGSVCRLIPGTILTTAWQNLRVGKPFETSVKQASL
jgi:hypothetical protein